MRYVILTEPGLRLKSSRVAIQEVGGEVSGCVSWAARHGGPCADTARAGRKRLTTGFNANHTRVEAFNVRLLLGHCCAELVHLVGQFDGVGEGPATLVPNLPATWPVGHAPIEHRSWSLEH